MKLSNRLTFCILSLFLFMAFVALPVMAHQLDPEVSPHLSADEDTEGDTGTNHALVKSITVSSGYLTATSPITATITFADGVAAVENDTTTTGAGNNEARHAILTDPDTDLAPGALTIMVGTKKADGSGYTYAAIEAPYTTGGAPQITAVIKTRTEGSGDTGSGSVYTAYISVPADADIALDGQYSVSVTTTAGVFNPADVMGEFRMDTQMPTVEDVNTRAIGQNYANLEGEWSDPFEITFSLEDPMDSADHTADPVVFLTDSVSGLKLSTLMFSVTTGADDTKTTSELTFGGPQFIGSNQYVVKATPVKTTTVKPAATVKVTIKVMDMAGNEGMSMPLTVKIAERAATGTGTGPGDTAPPTVTISDAAGTGTDADKVIFTFTFSEALATTGDNAFTVDDINISNTPDLVASNLTTTDNTTFKLTVTPENDKFPVKVSFKSGAKIGDAAGNVMVAAELAKTDTFTPEGVLGVEIDAPTALEFGVLTFTFTFAEEPAQADADGNFPSGAFTVNDVRATNAEPLVASNLRRLLKDADDDTDEVKYELAVTPMDATQPVRVQLLGRSVSNGGAGTTDDPLLIAGEVDATWTPPPPDTGPAPTDIMIPANSYVVVVRDRDAASGIRGLAFRNDVMVREWPDMPDLERLFYTGNAGIILGGGGGGALILKEAAAQTTNLAPGTVGISEIMWAIDANFLGNRDLSAYAGSQWIELHNLNTTAVRVMLSWKTGNAILSDTTITGNLARPVLDVVTNYFNDRPGNARWEVPGANGASVSGINFVSMARKGTFNLGSQDGGQFNKRYTRTGGATKSPDGRSSGQWEASSADYLSLRTTRTDGNDALFDYIGTPGRANTFSADKQTVFIQTRRNVPASPVIINEVANRLNSSKQFEWIELRNVTSADVNLRNYLISIVTSNSSDVPFYQFPNSNLNLPGGGVLLLVASDPRITPNHPLAVGWNVDGPADQGYRRGFNGLGIDANSKHGRYKVADPTVANRSGKFGGDQAGLPDEGNFVLILRSPDNHEGHGSGQHGGKGVAETGNADLNRVVDIAGYDSGLNRSQYPNAVSNTGLWPLYAMGGPFSHNNLVAGHSGAVHARRHATTNDGRAGTGGKDNKNDGGNAAFARNVGFTGIGYKRNVTRSNVLGGTPGYHAVEKGKVGDLTTGKVTISEIMLSQGNRGYPQWIELYNSSSTQTVVLDADDGWRLVIENPAVKIGTINFKAKGQVKRILPKQTVLVVSSAARSAGSDILRSSQVFPATRTFSVFREVAGEFGMTNRSDHFLNLGGFNIKLMDGKGTVSDEIGNLDGNPRTSDQPMWSYPSGMTEDGKRTSLIRIYDDGVARNGLSIATSNVTPLGTEGNGKKQTPVDKTYSWVHAVDTDATELRFVRHTWYGVESDYGTPGVRAGQTLPVSLSFFRPTLHDGKVTIRWTTESELDNAGFNIYRSESRTGEFKQVNENLIQGQGTTAERHTYSWVDTSAKPGVVYYYQIEDVSFAGERTQLAITKLKGLISATNKLTTTWGDLKEVH